MPFPKKILKKELITKVGSLFEAAQVLNIPYERIINIIRGRTYVRPKELKDILKLTNKSTIELGLEETLKWIILIKWMKTREWSY